MRTKWINLFSGKSTLCVAHVCVIVQKNACVLLLQCPEIRLAAACTQCMQSMNCIYNIKYSCHFIGFIYYFMWHNCINILGPSLIFRAIGPRAQVRNRNIFQGDKVTFPGVISAFFPLEIFILVDQNKFKIMVSCTFFLTSFFRMSRQKFPNYKVLGGGVLWDPYPPCLLGHCKGPLISTPDDNNSYSLQSARIHPETCSLTCTTYRNTA